MSPLISGNWKMNHNHFEAIQFVQKLSLPADARTTSRPVDVSVHPPFTDIRSVQTVIDADEIAVALGAQHCHWEDKGAFTGEVSPVFLAKLGVQYVIVGHSERRELFGETDEMVKPQGRGHPGARDDADHVRRRDARRARGRAHRRPRCSARCAPGSPVVSAEQVAAMVIAYEPIWAIGTGRTATRRRRPDGVRRDPWPRSPSCTAPRPPRRCASSTAAR